VVRKGIDFVAITEWIIWATTIVAALGALRSSPVRAIAFLPAAIIASWILHRTEMPPSWRVLGAVLLVVAWVMGTAFLTGAFDPPRGV
jgi:hypothetical protein